MGRIEQIEAIWDRYNPCNDKFDREILALRKQRGEIYKQEFNTWAAGKSYVLPTPEDADIATELRVGDIVCFTNDYGVEFAPLEVMGFRSSDHMRENCLYLNMDCYWSPVRLDQVRKLL